MNDKNGKIIDGVVAGLGILGVVVSAAAMYFGGKQAKIHREADKQSIITEVLDQINQK